MTLEPSIATQRCRTVTPVTPISRFCTPCQRSSGRLQTRYVLPSFVRLQPVILTHTKKKHRLVKFRASATFHLPPYRARVRHNHLAIVDYLPNIPADIVQDLYLREIKAYKPVPVVSTLNSFRGQSECLVYFIIILVCWVGQGCTCWRREKLLSPSRTQGSCTPRRPCIRARRVRCNRAHDSTESCLAGVRRGRYRRSG